MSQNFPQIGTADNPGYRIPHGSFFGRLADEYGIFGWFDLGDGELSETKEVTFKERYTNKTLAQVLAYRTPQRITHTIDIKLFQETGISKMIRAMGKSYTVEQAAIDAKPLSAGVLAQLADGLAKDQLVWLGARGLFDVELTSGGNPLTDADIFVHAESGWAKANRAIDGAITGTISAMAWKETRQKLAELAEIRLSIMCIPITPDGQDGEEIYYPLVGLATDGALSIIASGDDDYSVGAKGTVYADPATPSSPNGLVSSIPSTVAVRAAAAA